MRQDLNQSLEKTSNNKTIDEFRLLAKANNTATEKGYQLIDIHVVDIFQTLFYIEFATLHSQSVMRGFTCGYDEISPATNGVTDEVSTPSGSQPTPYSGSHDYCRSAMKYRGVENLWGNLRQLLDGINIKNYQAYVARNAKEYESDIFDGAYQPVNYINTKNSGYVVEMGFDPNNPFVQMAIEVNQNKDFSYYKDYYMANSGNRIVGFGGDWYITESAGISDVLPYFGKDDPRQSQGSRLVKTPF